MGVREMQRDHWHVINKEIDLELLLKCREIQHLNLELEKLETLTAIVERLLLNDLFFVRGDSKGLDNTTFEESRVRKNLRTNVKTNTPVSQYDFRSDGVIVMYLIFSF